MASALGKGIIGGAVIAVLGGVWIGAAALTSRQVELALAGVMDKPLLGGRGWVLSNLHHQAGLLSSSGSFELILDNGAVSGSQGPITLAVMDYRISHLPLPTSLNRIHWSLRPAGEIAETVTQALGPDIHAEGDGAMSYGGILKSDLKVSEINLKEQGGLFHMTALTGSLVADDKTAALTLALPAVEASSAGNTASATGITTEMALTDLSEGTGKVVVGIEKIATNQAAIEGLKLTSESHDHDGRRDGQFGIYAASAQGPEFRLKDLAVEFAMRDLDIQAIHMMRDSLRARTAPVTTPDEALAVIRPSLVRLVQKGFTVEVPRLSGAAFTPDGKQGAVDLKASLTLAPTPESGLSLASQLSSKGSAKLSGDALPEQQKQMALLMGVAVPDGNNGLSSDYDLSSGTLTLNGKPFDPAPVRQALAMTQMQLAAFLSGMP